MTTTGTDFRDELTEIVNDTVEAVSDAVEHIGDDMSSWWNRFAEVAQDVMGIEDKAACKTEETCRVHPDHTPIYNRTAVVYGETLAGFAERLNHADYMASAALTDRFALARDNVNDSNQLADALNRPKTMPNTTDPYRNEIAPADDSARIAQQQNVSAEKFGLG